MEILATLLLLAAACFGVMRMEQKNKKKRGKRKGKPRNTFRDHRRKGY